MYEELAMYIDGEWCQGSDGAHEEVINPATEESLARLPHASAADLDRALAAADKGFAQWRATSAYERAGILYKAGDLMRQRADAIARTLTMEQGKGLAEARMEVMVSADIFQWYAEEGKRAYGRIIPSRIPRSRQKASTLMVDWSQKFRRNAAFHARSQMLRIIGRTFSPEN